MLGQGLEQFNNLTGDIELNPQSFGLFMKDIEEASLALKTAIYSGNVNLTASYYKEMESIAEQKYSLISTDGGIEGNKLGEYYGIDPISGDFYDKNMTGKTPGLYMDHKRLGFWNGTNWNVAITNSGQAFFGSEIQSNYMQWTGTELKIKGNLVMTGGSISWDYVTEKPIIPVLPSYIQETKITSTTIESPIISANNGYISGTLKVGSSGGTIDILGGSKVIRSSNYSSGTSGWNISFNGDAEFNNVKVRGEIADATFKGKLLYDSISTPSIQQGLTWCEPTKDRWGDVVLSQKVLHGYFGDQTFKQQISTNGMILDESLSLTNDSPVTMGEFFILHHWFKPRFIECQISFRKIDGTVNGISIGKLSVNTSSANFIWYSNSGLTSGSSNSTNYIGGNDYFSGDRDVEVVVDSTNDYLTTLKLQLKPNYQAIGKFYVIG